MAMLSSGMVGEAASTQAQSQACHATALQLLLRLLPFRLQNNKISTGQYLQQNQHTLLAELHKNPLWRYSSLDNRHPAFQGPLRGTVPLEAHDALLDYVRLAAEADQHQRPKAMHRIHRRDGHATAAEVAAELHALYALAAVHAATQQQQSYSNRHGPVAKNELDDREFLAMLSAYASLGEQSSSGNEDAQPEQQQCSEGSMASGDWQGTAGSAAAAVQALYAFAALAESQQQQQQAPGQLQVKTAEVPAAASKCGAIVCKQVCDGGSNASKVSNYRIASCDEQQELEVLLKLAQLGAQA